MYFARRVASHTALAVLEAGLIALLVVGLVAGSAFAGKGGGKPTGGGSSSISWRMVDTSDSVANHGDQVTFDVSSTATTQPMVRLECTQGGDLVYTSSAGFYPDYPWPWAQIFTLESGAWTAGAADCTATLYYYNGRRYSNLKTTSLHVNA